MLVELLRTGTPELSRRWLAALMMVPASERAGVVSAVERQIVATYCAGEDDAPTLGTSRHLHVVSAPVQRDGYVEQVERTYEVKATAPKPKAQRKRRKA